MPTTSNASPESPVITSETQKPSSFSSKAFQEAWSKIFLGRPSRTPTKLPKRRRSKALSHVKWSRIFLVLDDRNHEETSATINEGGSRTRRTNRIVAIAEIKTQTGDRT